MTETTTADPSAPGVSELAEVLRVHEARWRTHGYERPHDVMHCLGDCKWRLRQKVGMDTEAMYAAHRRHVAEVIAASGVVVPAAEVEALAEDFDSEVDWSAGRNNYGDNDAWLAAARRTRALLARLAGEGR